MRNFLVYTILLLVVGCKKYEQQFGTSTNDTTDNGASRWEVVYSTNSGVFLLDGAFTKERKIANLSGFLPTDASRVAISNDGTKVAYTDANGMPIIVDTLGNILHQLSQYSDVMDLGWAGNDSTLYILTNNQVFFFGPALDLPTPLFDIPANAQNVTITSLDINDNLDVLYSALYYVLISNNTELYWVGGEGINYKNSTNSDYFSPKKYGISCSNVANPLDCHRTYLTMSRFFDEQWDQAAHLELSIIVGSTFDTYTYSGMGMWRGGLGCFIRDDGMFRKLMPEDAFNISLPNELEWNTNNTAGPFYYDWRVR